MDVHHQHHVAHKKKWTEYILEFLMLFLAVFLGFTAENIREHKIEDVRAKKFAKSLVNDLKKDTAAIEFYKTTAKQFSSISDTLLKLNREGLTVRNAAKFCFYSRFIYWTQHVGWSRTTFEQIKNSGSLRYFKHELLEKLMMYDAVLNTLERAFYNHETRGNNLLNSINKIVDPQMHEDASQYFIYTFDTISTNTLNKFFTRETVALEINRSEVTELLNMIVVQKRNLRFEEGRLNQAKNLAIELIKEFTEEYHLK
jgi:hypothetical protein